MRDKMKEKMADQIWKFPINFHFGWTFSGQFLNVISGSAIGSTVLDTTKIEKI